MKNLLIIESPNKIKTISKILKSLYGNIFIVKASKGHILNLPANEYAISFEPNGINAKWVYEDSKRKFINEIVELSKSCENIYIATDLDREGERIGLDIIQKAKLQSYKRITFCEITEDAIKEAIDNYREIDISTAETAKTRRIIDRTGGYGISDIMKFDLKRKGVFIPDNLAVGRSQSPALHILAKLEKEREDFIEEDYLRIRITYQHDGIQFSTTDDTRYMLNDPSSMEQLKMIIHQLSDNKDAHIVNKISETTVERRASAPLITSDMQKSAFNLFSFRGEHSMKLAKDLFEQGGWITYYRTDSVSISKKAYHSILELLYTIAEKTEEELKTMNPETLKTIDFSNKIFTNDILDAKAKYKQKKGAAVAHECIRPAHIEEKCSPDNIMSIWETNYPGVFTHEHLSLYSLIWFRTIATQLKPACYDDREVVINIEGNLIEAKSHNIFAKQTNPITGEQLDAKGFLKLKENILEESEIGGREFFKQKPKYIPSLRVDQSLNVIEIKAIQSHTEAPYRYGEGRFIQTLEKFRIAKPSTIATIIPSLESKGLISRKGKILEVERLGMVVDEWITTNVPWLNSIEEALEFDEKLEKLENDGDLDEIEIFAMQYNNKVEDLKDSLGITDEDLNLPSDDLVTFAKSIANKKNITLSEKDLKDKAALKNFVSKNVKKIKKEDSLGNCPECKKGKIYNREKAYSCEKWKDGCKFTIWKNNITKFFKNFGKEVTEEYISSIIPMLLKKEQVICNGLQKRNGEKFNSILELKKDNTYGWGIVFGKNKKFIKKTEALRAVKEELKVTKESAAIDGMTKLYRKEKLFEDLEKLFANPNLKGMVNLAFVDGDRFKGINDHFGHDAGDEVLKYIASKLINSAEKLKGKAYRYGGEEFILVCCNKHSENVLNDLDSLRIDINSEKVEHNNHSISVSVSIGVTSFLEGDTYESLIKRADDAVYKAKENGRNQIVKG